MTQALADGLTRFAETASCPYLSPVIDRLRRPIRVAVHGRAGVGRTTVAAGLRQRGVAVASDGSAEVRLLVIAEAVKPEDRVVLTSSPRPALIVLTKVDLAGAGAGGPMVAARRTAADMAAMTGIPTVPVIGLLAALAVLDDDLVAALGAFVTEPPNLASVDAFVDAFVDGDHEVGRDVRALLLRRLDRFGIAHAVLALANGTTPAKLTEHLRRLGNLDEVQAALEVAAAPARYLRVEAAIAELRSLAVRLDDDRVSTLMAADDTVLASMTAAVDVVEAAGLTVDRGDTGTAHVERAVRWRRYGRGPVNALHRRCGEDIVRGSLRLLTEKAP